MYQNTTLCLQGENTGVSTNSVRCNIALFARSATVALGLFVAVLPIQGQSNPAQAAVSVSLDSPADYQVFQRQTREKGKVLVSGRVPEACPRVEARLTGASMLGKLPGQWKRLPLDCRSHAFRAEWSVPAGGFYEFDLRTLKAGKPVFQTAVPHVGVGEVFVIAGQSNSTNYGEVRQQTKLGMVVSFSGDAWRSEERRVGKEC